MTAPKATIGDVLVHLGEPEDGNPYRGASLMGPLRVLALRAFLEGDPLAAQFTYWYGPASGGARRLEDPDGVRWDTSGILARSEAARAHDLLPAVAQYPPPYATEEIPTADKLALVKLFTPWTSWTWYIVEADAAGRCFGYVDGLERELGYFDAKEIRDLRGPAGLRVERDLHFRPTRLGALYPDLEETEAGA